MPIVYVYVLVKIYMQIYLHTLTYINSTGCPSYTSTSEYNRTYADIYAPALHSHKKTFVTSFIKTHLGYITISTAISSWNPAPIIAPGGWVTTPSDTWRNWKPECPKNKAPGRAIFF